MKLTEYGKWYSITYWGFSSLAVGHYTRERPSKEMIAKGRRDNEHSTAVVYESFMGEESYKSTLYEMKFDSVICIDPQEQRFYYFNDLLFTIRYEPLSKAMALIKGYFKGITKDEFINLQVDHNKSLGFDRAISPAHEAAIQALAQHWDVEPAPIIWDELKKSEIDGTIDSNDLSPLRKMVRDIHESYGKRDVSYV